MGGLWCKLPYGGSSCLEPGGPVSSTMAPTFSQRQNFKEIDTFLAAMQTHIYEGDFSDVLNALIMSFK